MDKTLEFQLIVNANIAAIENPSSFGKNIRFSATPFILRASELVSTAIFRV